jgi:N-acetylmuramoyl-L-alanine amidase
MFEYVKDAHLAFNEALEKREKTDLIVLHHSEGGAAETVESIHQYHLSKGHKGIDYNICVLKNGDVYWGRGLDAEGGHVSNSWPKTAGVNARSVGIVCLGNFNTEQMGDKQLNALKQVTADVVRHFGLSSLSQIVTHRGIAGEDYTDCPGINFPTNEVRDYILHGVKNAEPDPAAPKFYRVTVQTLNFRQTPDLNAPVICTLHHGDRVELGRYVEGEDWARVIFGGKTGWVWRKFIGE